MSELSNTNIAGSPFQPYVATQIEKRKSLIEKQLRSPQELQWLTNKNAWIRVSSGANVNPDNNRFGGLHGDALSKKYILQAGVIDHTVSATSYQLRYGIGDNGSYGIGGSETFGSVPMPGITDMTINTGGKLGTLKEINISFTCYNMKQLDIMEALYMKLGFGLLVEWGHTFYIDNDTGKIENVVEPIPFYGIKTKEELLKTITAHRIKHSGNYDASWSTVKNFSYALSDNGSFKCTISLVGAGDILESLKINLSGGTKPTVIVDPPEKSTTDKVVDTVVEVAQNAAVTVTDVVASGVDAVLSFVGITDEGDVKKAVNDFAVPISKNEEPKATVEELTATAQSSSIYPVVSEANQSMLNIALYSIFSTGVTNGETTETYKFDTSSEYFTSLEPFLNNLNIKVADINSFATKNNELIRKGFHYKLINNPKASTKENGDIDSTIPAISFPSFFFSRAILGYEINGEALSTTNDTSAAGLEQVYITLGHLLLLVKSNGMLFQRQSEGDKTNQTPYIYIDVNPDTNRCYTFQGHCSMDPTICLIGSNNLPFGIKSPTFDAIKSNYPWFDNNGTGGRFMWTLVNINWITSILKDLSASNTKGDVFMIDFLQKILDGISKATGGYNEFRVVPDDDSRCIRIFDGRKVTQHGPSKEIYTEIPVLGNKSLAYNFNYTSKIAPNMAAMIVIAAQAQPFGVQGAENALSFSHLNKGMHNRLDSVIVDSGTDKNKEEKTNSNDTDRYIEVRDFIQEIYEGSGGADPIIETDTTNPVVKKDKNGNIIPEKPNIKQLLLNALTTSYNDLLKLAAGGTEEKAALAVAYKSTKDYINSKEGFNVMEGVVLAFSTKTKDKIEISDSVIFYEVLRKLGQNYDSPNTFDSDVESAWEDYADKKTNHSEHNFF
jgi:hypothetical protein